MFRNTTVAPDLNRRQPLRTAGLWMALAVPVFAPVLLAVVTVQSVSLSRTDVSSGSLAATGTVTLSALSAQVSVAVFSSKPSLANVPPKISVTGQTGTFKISTVPGQAGCTTFSAQVVGTSTITSSALLFVQPTNSPGPVTLTLSPGSVLGSASATGTVLVTPFGTGVVQLTSSNPSVTVPATAPLSVQEGGYSKATFTIGTALVQPPGTCAIITATFQGSQSRALLKVTPIVAG